MKTITSSENSSVPDAFLNKFGHLTQGAIAGFDRLRLRGTLRYLYHDEVMAAYLNACRVLLKDFGKFVDGITQRVRRAAFDYAAGLGRPYHYLRSSQRSKEEIARQIAQKDGLTSGLITLLGCVEPCLSYGLRKDPVSRKLCLELGQRRCLHFYYYYLHPSLGFMNVRVQSWFPFQIDICLNGREWLARQMDAAGLAYRKKENCFVWIGDFDQAQALAQAQLRTEWKPLLDSFLPDCHPLYEEICRPIAQEYYWSAAETEFATDLVFRDPKELARIYPQFVRHGISTFNSPDVMRFLGRRVPSSTGRVHERFEGEIISDLKTRAEGIRLKHSLNGNSIKLYDKQGAVLRVETTINNPSQFKVYRTKEGDPERKLEWRELRKGVADLARRAEVSNAANQRYLTALASVTGKEPIGPGIAQVCQPVKKDGRRIRPLNPWSPEDAKLLRAVSDGRFAINGLRNRDLRLLLFIPSADPAVQRRQAAATGRKLRLLRDHGLLKKVSGTHRYVLTTKGRQITTSLFAAYQADVEQLAKLAA